MDFGVPVYVPVTSYLTSDGPNSKSKIVERNFYSEFVRLFKLGMVLIQLFSVISGEVMSFDLTISFSRVYFDCGLGVT